MTTEPDRIPVSDLRDDFSTVVAQVAFGGRRVVITHHGRDRCALVSMEDFARLTRAENAAGSSPADDGGASRTGRRGVRAPRRS